MIRYTNCAVRDVDKKKHVRVNVAPVTVINRQTQRFDGSYVVRYAVFSLELNNIVHTLMMS